MSPTTCVLCSVYARGTDPEPADRVRSCRRCRLQLERDIGAVAAMHKRASDPDEQVADARRRADGTARDRVATMLPMAATPPPSKQPRVSGSRERTVPVNVRLLDLIDPVPRDLDLLYLHQDDQIGEVSVVSVLAAWMWRWKHLGFWAAGTGQTRLTVAAMSARLLMGNVEIVADLDP